MGMSAGTAGAVEQATAPESARPPRLEEQWKARLNANTVSIIAGSPEETYLDITHDLAVVLNDDNLRIVPMVGMGGAQNIRDVLYLKGVDIGITSSQMLRYFASTGELSTALDQRLTYITRLYPGRNARRGRPRRQDDRGLERQEGELLGIRAPARKSRRATYSDCSVLRSMRSISVRPTRSPRSRSGEIAATVVFSGKPDGHLLPRLRERQSAPLGGPLHANAREYLSAGTARADALSKSDRQGPDRSRPSRSIPSSSRTIGRRRAIDIVASRSSSKRCSPGLPSSRNRRDIRNGRRLTSNKELPGWQRFPAAQELLQQAKFDEFQAQCPGRQCCGSVGRRQSSDCSGSSATGRKARARQ